MDLIDVPRTGLKVSRVATGTWATGGGIRGATDEAESISPIPPAVEVGINVLDAAPRVIPISCFPMRFSDDESTALRGWNRSNPTRSEPLGPEFMMPPGRRITHATGSAEMASG
ncbi:MAG TPA: hypothetical protein VHU90_14225 [Galbitalea sp.]|jgi:hypothetical protein|nr:hypothetical protein [Galbitalea sp.]